MSTTPEYGEQERMDQQSAQVKHRSEDHRLQEGEDIAGDEIAEHEQAEREAVHLEPEDHEAHAPGRVCGRCGVLMTADQDARRLTGDTWIHEVCPH